MPKFIDLKGQKFHRLTVLERDYSSKCGQPKWLCRCDCGNIVSVFSSNIKRKNTQSCGCLNQEVAKNRLETHGFTGTRIHNIWMHMNARCNNPKSDAYDNYGGRGIKACDEWVDFTPFRDWALSHGYSDNLTIDRINNNGNYEPSNCRWSTAEVQSNNRRSNHYIIYNGENKTLMQLSKEFRISYGALKYRIKCGWAIEQALTKPIKKMKRRASA